MAKKTKVAKKAAQLNTLYLSRSATLKQIETALKAYRANPQAYADSIKRIGSKIAVPVTKRSTIHTVFKAYMQRRDDADAKALLDTVKQATQNAINHEHKLIAEMITMGGLQDLCRHLGIPVPMDIKHGASGGTGGYQAQNPL